MHTTAITTLHIRGLLVVFALVSAAACREGGKPEPIANAGGAGGAAGAIAGATAAGASGTAGAGAAPIAGASGAAGAAGSGQTGMRLQDSRTFMIDPATIAFDALPNSTVETDRWSGILDGAGYRIEVPKTWNGMLVVYAHGYTGPVPALRLTTPPIRAHLIGQGYAWVASSYTKNYYDVRAGVEDTNKLALAFNKIAADNGRTLAEPTKRYIIGHSMGGHVTAAAIEKEASTTAVNKVRYYGAVPMCGVVGDTELFNYFAAYQLAAQQLTDVPVSDPPVADFAPISMQMQQALFTTFPTATTPLGETLKGIVMNLSGGARPNFEFGFASKIWQDIVWGTFGGDGTISGVLVSSVIDTSDLVYQLDSDPAQSDEERTFNMQVPRVTAAADANALRSDGLRWIPKVNGEFEIPVVTLHTLGDLFVPFKMEQIYRQRAMAKGSVSKLVQRAIRATGHCEFSTAEQIAAFDAMIRWEQDGVMPEGDEVLDPKVVSDPNYGCKFTNNAFTPEETAAGMLPTARAAGAAACPSAP